MPTVATPEQLDAIGRAAYTVASAGGTAPLSTADRAGITSALGTVFGGGGRLDVDALATIASGELVRVIEDGETRLDLVRVLCVLALLDGVVDKPKIDLVVDIASALHVHAEFVDALHQLRLDHARWVGYDMIRANVFTIPGIPWVPDDPYAPFLPYGADGHDPVLRSRYERLEGLDEGTFGRSFFDHYVENGYAFPGDTDALAEIWATPFRRSHPTRRPSRTTRSAARSSSDPDSPLPPPCPRHRSRTAHPDHLPPRPETRRASEGADPLADQQDAQHQDHRTDGRARVVLQGVAPLGQDGLGPPPRDVIEDHRRDHGR